MGVRQFTIAHMHRYQRKIHKLETGIAEVHEHQEKGEIISAKRVYNRKLCYAYAETRVLLKDRFNFFLKENKPDLAKEELARVRKAFEQFFEIGESFDVDLSEQRRDSTSMLENIENTFKDL